MKANRNSLKHVLNEEHKAKVAILSAYVSGRRRIKPIIKRLRNLRVGSIMLYATPWSESISHAARFYLSRRVSSMKDVEGILAKIDAIPVSKTGVANGWRTKDNPHDGTRLFARTFYWRGVDIAIELTAIPEESGVAKCRRVVVGQKESVERSTTPVYEIVCDD